MAIAGGTPGLGFTREWIGHFAPHSSGVYALYNARRWIYVGQCEDIQRRLLEHFAAETDTCIQQQVPSGFAFELVTAARRVARQNDLLRTLNFSCNQRFGQRRSRAVPPVKA